MIKKKNGSPDKPHTRLHLSSSKGLIQVAPTDCVKTNRTANSQTERKLEKERQEQKHRGRQAGLGTVSKTTL